MAKRNQRKWNEKFLQYMEYIVKHPNYKDMPNKFDDNGNIRWVRTEKSDPVLTKWWDDMVKKLKPNCKKQKAARKEQYRKLNLQNAVIFM